MKKIHKQNYGFTLVETLVAISIFTISILGILSVLAQGISNTNYAKQKVIASYLAQEGIEYMRNMRDSYVLYDSESTQIGWAAFNANLTDISSCQSDNGCYFDDRNDYANHSQGTWKTNLMLFVCGSTCPLLKYDVTSGKYNYLSGTDTFFRRKIKVVVSPDETETKIISTVSWTQASGNYSIVFSDSLFNWME